MYSKYIFKNKNNLIIIISWTAVLLWMLLIYNLSSQVADQSNKLSTGVTEIIVETVEKVVPEYYVDIARFNHLIRKYAHFSAYLVLGVLLMNALKRSGIQGLRICILALGVCFLYAVSDELHQLFVSGRSGQVLDVLIDSVGASVGIGIYLLALKIFRVDNKGDINGNISRSTT